MMVITKDYAKKTLDISSLQINSGYVKSKTIDEDTYAMAIQANADFVYAAMQSQLLSERNKELIEITKDIRNFLNRIGVDSTFVKQIQEVIRMGQDLVNISVDIINSTTEDEPIEDTIKDIAGDNGDTDDIINNEVGKAEESLVPPFERENIINTGKTVVEATKEAAKEANTDVKTTSTEVTNTPVSVTPEAVAEAKANYEDVAKDTDVAGSKTDPNELTIYPVSVATTSRLMDAIDEIFRGEIGTTGIVAMAMSALAYGTAYREDIILGAADDAQTAYTNTIANGGTRSEAKAAAADAMRSEASKVVDTSSVGDKIINTVIGAIEDAVGQAIERAGGDVTDFFGGCGCDDECTGDDCADTCNSDCGCDDSGCAGYTHCDEAPCDGCPSNNVCSNDNPDCPNDCSSQCDGCPSDGCDGCPSDCPSDCPSNVPCSDEEECPADNPCSPDEP